MTYYTIEQLRFRKKNKRKRKHKKRKLIGYHYSQRRKNTSIIIKSPIIAPSDFRFTSNPEKSLYFFNSLRSRENCSIVKGQISYRISLSKVTYIDFATISILKSIFEESKYYGISIQGNLPKDQSCKDELINSGFLNKMYDNQSQEINIKAKGSHFSFEKKQGRLTVKDLENFDDISNRVYKHLMGFDGYSDAVIRLLKEIGGNAVEWANSYNNQWQIGVFLMAEKVIINATDLGRGIRDSLYVSNKLKLIDIFLMRDDLDILERAFDRRYGSLSQEINRNQGLPSIKSAYDNRQIESLIVCSNNVILDFGNKKSKLLKKDNLNFSGTFYQWEITANCLK